MIKKNCLTRLSRKKAEMKSREPKKEKKVERLNSYIVVTQVGSYVFGIMVDRVFDTQEIVVKPVSPILSHMTLFAGNTILGDGSVVMILDPNGIASEVGDISTSDGADQDKSRAESRKKDEQVSLLIFSAGEKSPKAVPLALVSRLEEIDMKDVEYSGNMPMVQYREKLMPLVPFSGAVHMPEEGKKPLLVFSERDRYVGLVVDEIIDIVDERLDIKMKSQQPGCFGTAVLAGRATDIVDTEYYVRQAYPDWHSVEAKVPTGDKKRLLFVEDSVFFRNLLTPILRMEGYEVVDVENAAEAIEILENDRDFDVIVSDIEMPNMDGYQFVKAVREMDDWEDVPVIALTSHVTPEDFEKGRQAGFTDYLAKLDRQALLDTLSKLLDDERSAAA